MIKLIFTFPKFIIWIMSLSIVVLAYQDFLLGGNEWKQGDWLINNVESFVRRGVFGSALLWFSQATSLNPLLLVVILQIILLITSVVLLGKSIEQLSCPNTLWLMVLSPGFFISLWALDPQGGLRKELIVFLAFSVLLFSVSRFRPNLPLIYSSVLIYALAVFGHEGNVFFAPFLGFCYLMLFTNRKISACDFAILLGIVTISAVSAVAVALSFGRIDNYMTVCQPLLDVGLRVGICEGAIKSLSFSLRDFLSITYWMFFSPRVLSFALMYGLASIPPLFIGAYLFDRGAILKYYIGSAFFFLPLYFVAVDWGRWLSFHVTAVIFTMLIALSLDGRSHKTIPEIRPVPYIVLLIFSLTWGTSHFVFIMWGGALLKFIRGASLFFNHLFT